jgi:heme-degrading monooxygenase HmoA
MAARANRPSIARIWRGRTTRARADEYEAYNYEVGIKPLIEEAIGVQTSREDRADDTTEFVTISYWESVDAMARFKEATDRIHHLERDPEYLVELPQSVQVLEIRRSHGHTSPSDDH